MDQEDQMVLENIDEYVNDQNRVVTYKWLSLTLSIHVNKSKSLLEEYANSSKVPLNIVYFVGGRKDIGLCKGVEYTLSRSVSLQDVKNEFSELLCCHVYSIQKAEIKDPEVLYSVDVDITKENLSHINKFSSIECQQPIKTNKQNKQVNKVVNNTQSEVKHETKKEIKKESPPLSFFNKKPAGEKLGTRNEPKQTEVKTKNTKTDKANIASSFLKAKPKEDVKKDGANVTTKREIDEVQTKEADSEDEKKKKKQDREENKKVEEQNPKNVEKSKKRKCVIDESESDEDFENFVNQTKDPKLPGDDQKKEKKKNSLAQENEDVDVDVVAPTPEPVEKRKTKRRRKEAIEEKEAKEESVTKGMNKSPSPVDVEQNGAKNEKRRKRRKVLKSKQFVNEEGFMVTQKGWESESYSEESDNEQRNNNFPVKKNNETKKAEQVLETKTKAHLRKPKHQSSMKNFFKKK
ncbi:DNA polymerase delta subunit 3-like [Hydractinia symbiolongicarpus]|uniref:DNA polymerase delta subunit 3-like n=1 Tax=Hydractinia symbiolongicarpus TaxID=13093 RepID=UPI00254AEC0D|nr:DNA polymerase delta subunit 3-like [Hydractinia symbiolongicarpus]